LRPIGLGQDTLDHQGVDVDKADLQQVNFLGGVQREMSEALTLLDRHSVKKSTRQDPAKASRLDRALAPECAA
jgi:hypothetical protein